MVCNDTHCSLDLVEISPNANPPVCKIMDFGKFKYETQKREAEARKKQKIIEIKEVKFRPNTDTNDYDPPLGGAAHAPAGLYAQTAHGKAARWSC